MSRTTAHRFPNHVRPVLAKLNERTISKSGNADWSAYSAACMRSIAKLYKDK